MNKKAYMRTLEAVIAMVISFIFITFIVTNKTSAEIVQPNINLLEILEQNPLFRNCVMSENYPCLNSTLLMHYPDFTELYGYRFNITTDPNTAVSDLPEKEVRLESLFIAGNDTYLYPRVVRLYYWIK